MKALSLLHKVKDVLTGYDDIAEADEAIAEIEELELFKSEHLRLEAELNQILHPNGDGPTNPSFCDLVAYVRSDVKVMQRGGYLPEGVSINQVVGELHRDYVIPKAMQMQRGGTVTIGDKGSFKCTEVGLPRIGELHSHDLVIPEVIWAQSENLVSTPEVFEKLKAKLSEVPIIPMGLTPIVEPSCDGCLHLPMKRIPHKLRICNFCTRTTRAFNRWGNRDHYYSQYDYDAKRMSWLRGNR